MKNSPIQNILSDQSLIQIAMVKRECLDEMQSFTILLSLLFSEENTYSNNIRKESLFSFFITYQWHNAIHEFHYWFVSKQQGFSTMCVRSTPSFLGLQTNHIYILSITYSNSLDELWIMDKSP